LLKATARSANPAGHTLRAILDVDDHNTAKIQLNRDTVLSACGEIGLRKKLGGPAISWQDVVFTADERLRVGFAFAVNKEFKH
jgi:hypothetical protein